MIRYSSVFVDAIGYELAPVIVTSAELEGRLQAVYQAQRWPDGQLEALTGIVERRVVGRRLRALRRCPRCGKKGVGCRGHVPACEVEVLLYAGVCRELFEPATACRVAAGLNVSPAAAVYDISNACLGVLNGMLDIANRIDLGQIRAGLVVSCESAREINDVMIERMLGNKSMDFLKLSLATLTGGSGARGGPADGRFVWQQPATIAGRRHPNRTRVPRVVSLGR